MKGAAALPVAVPAGPAAPGDARGQAAASCGPPFSGPEGAKAPGLTGTHMPSRDGFRAIPILMVCYGHLCGTRHFPVSIAEYGRWRGDVAHLGVLVFFAALSSWLPIERPFTSLRKRLRCGNELAAIVLGQRRYRMATSPPR